MWGGEPFFYLMQWEPNLRVLLLWSSPPVIRSSFRKCSSILPIDLPHTSYSLQKQMFSVHSFSLQSCAEFESFWSTQTNSGGGGVVHSCRCFQVFPGVSKLTLSRTYQQARFVHKVNFVFGTKADSREQIFAGGRLVGETNASWTREDK